MKPVGIGCSVGLDRLATWNEVTCALSVSAQGALAPIGDSDDLRPMDSDFSGIGWKLSEETMWLAIVSEMPDSNSN